MNNIKRIYGFIDLNKYFEQKYNLNTLDELDQNKLISAEFSTQKTAFWLDFYNNKVLFKDCKTNKSAYLELINEELIKLINLETAHYDLAKFDNYYGVITYDFKKENYKYIHLFSILLKYYKDIILNSNKLLNKGYKEVDKFNNLIDIKSALEYYFKDNKNKNVIVSKLMIDIVKLFSFDLLMNQTDRHSANYGIFINNDTKEVLLAPVFDYGESLNKNSKYYNSIVTDSNYFLNENKSKKYIIESFIQKFPKEYTDIFYEILNIININTLNNAIKNVEYRCQTTIPKNIKEDIFDSFADNYIEIVNTIENSKNNKDGVRKK